MGFFNAPQSSMLHVNNLGMEQVHFVQVILF